MCVCLQIPYLAVEVEMLLDCEQIEETVELRTDPQGSLHAPQLLHDAVLPHPRLPVRRRRQTCSAISQPTNQPVSQPIPCSIS